MTHPYWIVLGDIHDHVGRIAEIPGLQKAEGIIVSGDITLMGGAHQAKKVIEAIREHKPVLFAQIGNMDRPEVTGWLSEEGINLHGAVRELTPDIALIGIGGSTFTPFATPSEFPESWYAEKLEHLWHTARKYKRCILVSHNPPKNTACDDIGEDRHVGSEAVREFIQEAQPDMCICGHIHEARAMDRIGRTVVINPGPFQNGGYLVLRLENGKPFVEMAQLPA